MKTQIFFFVISFFCFYACSNNQNTSAENNKTDESKRPEDIYKDEQTPVIDQSYDIPRSDSLNVALMKVAPVIDEESDRYIDEFGHLHLEIVNSATPTEKEFELIRKLFPDFEISEPLIEDVYKAYNVKKGDEAYNVIVFYQNHNNLNILSHVVISYGEFSIKILEDLFS